MGGSELTEFERITRIMAEADRNTAAAAANATRGSGLFDQYQDPTNAGSISREANPYASIDEIARRPEAHLDLSMYKLGGPEGLAQKLIADLPSGIIEPSYLRRYITTNLDLQNPAESKVKLLAGLIMVDPSIRNKVTQTYAEHAEDLAAAEKEGPHKLHQKKTELLEQVLYEQLMDMHKRGLAARPQIGSQRATQMEAVIKRYFSPDERIDITTDPAEKARSILIGLSNPELSHEQRERRVKSSLEMLSDMPELRSEVRAELRRYQDMASTSAQELHDALQSKDPAAALGAVLIGKSRGQNAGLDEMQLILDAYKEKFPGRDFERDLEKARDTGKIDREQYALLSTMLKDGFNPITIAQNLRTEMDDIRPYENLGMTGVGLGQCVLGAGAILAAGIIPYKSVKSAEKLANDYNVRVEKFGIPDQKKDPAKFKDFMDSEKRMVNAHRGGVLNSFMRNPALIGGTGLLALYGTNRLEQLANSDGYKRVTTILSGLSSEQMQQVQVAYSGSGLTDILKSSPDNEARLVDLNFLNANRNEALSAERKQEIAHDLVKKMREIENPDAIAGMLINTFGSLDKTSVDDIVQRANSYIHDGFLQPVMEPSGQTDAEGKPVMQIKKNADGSPVMAVQVPEGQAANFQELFDQSLSGADSAVYELTLSSMRQGYSAERLASQALAIVNQMNAFRAPDSATSEQKQDFESVLKDLTSALDASQLADFKEAWKRQISTRTQLAEDITNCVKDAEVHSQMTTLLAGNNRLWHLDRSNYMHTDSKENPLVTLGIQTGQQDVLSHVDNLARALHENNPGSTLKAIEGMSDTQLSSIDELIDAFHGAFDTKTLERHLDKKMHKTAVELGYNPYKRRAELDALIASGSTSQIASYLETIAGSPDKTVNPQHTRKLELFLEIYGPTELVKKLQENNPEALKLVISNSQNQALQLAIKPLIGPEIATVLSDSSKSLERRAQIAETFFARELLTQGIKETQYITDALTAIDIVASGTFTPAQVQTLRNLFDKNAASNQQIVTAYQILQQGRPEMSSQLFELFVPLRYELLKSRFQELGIDYSIDGVQPLSDLVRSGAERGHMELVYNFSGVRQKYSIDLARMERLEGLEQGLRRFLADNPEAAEEGRASARKRFKAILSN